MWRCIDWLEGMKKLLVKKKDHRIDCVQGKNFQKIKREGQIYYDDKIIL